MILTDEDALRCDLAETYHIFDYESLPVLMVATFSLGLRDDSRIKQKMSGDKVPLNSTLLSIIADSLRTLVWFKTKDGVKGNNRPESLYDLLHSEPEAQEKKFDVLDTPEDFDMARQQILDNLKKGG